MKKVKVLTDSSTVKKHFTTIERSRSWEIEYLPVNGFRNIINNDSETDLYLLDNASVTETEKQKTLNYILRHTSHATGVIDRRNEISDPAMIISRGTDYIGNNLLKEGIKTERLNKSIDIHEIFSLNIKSRTYRTMTEKTSKPDTDAHIISKDGWNGIKSGDEYSFLMMFTEISIPEEWKKKSGSDHLNQLKQIFHDVIRRETAPYDGRIWIWNEYGGLILFPFDGETIEGVIPAVKLLLNRTLISIEDFRLHSTVNLRIASHIGRTVYQSRGKTGTIISDSINSLFHLGTKFTPLNDMDITESLYLLLPENIQKLFSPAGFFENREIYRLCHFEVA